MEGCQNLVLALHQAEEVHVEKETETERANSGLKGEHYDQSVYSVTQSESQKVTQA